MKKFLTYNQFETELKNENIPEIDLNKVKIAVSELSGSDRRTLGNRKKMILVIAVVIFTLCFGTVAMAIYNGWQLKNKKGEVVLNYTKGDQKELANFVRGWQQRPYFDGIEGDTIESLDKGEMAYYLVPEEYEINKNFVVLQKEEEIFDLEKLKKSTTTKFKVPGYLPDSYKFEYGIVTFKEENADKKYGEALYQEVKKTGKDYIIKKGKLTKESKRIMLKYVNAEGYKLTIIIWDITNMKSYEYDYDTIEKLTASEKEILYIKSEWPDVDRYVFVDEDAPQRLTYLISNSGMNEVLIWGSDKTSLELPKEEAIKMIKSFK